MERSVRRRTSPYEVRSRILEVAEEHFRRLGHRKTSVADIAFELGMSPANVYRFFPSKDAISKSICTRILNEATDIAFAIARTNTPAMEKLDRVLSAVHQHNKTKLIKERRIHDMIVAATQENWGVIREHVARMSTILEAIIGEGVEAGEFEVEDPAEAARAVTTAFTPFFHPVLIEHCVQRGEDTEANLRAQSRFILKALGKSEFRGLPQDLRAADSV